MNRILKTRYLKNQVGGDHHQSGNSHSPYYEQATASVHRQGNRHRSDSEVDRQHQKSFPDQRYAPHSITPTDPRKFRPQSVSTWQDQCAATHVSHQHDPTTQRPGSSSSQVSGAPRRIDTANLNRVEHRHSLHEHVKLQVRTEPGVNKERESSTSMSRLQQQRPTQLKLSTSTTSDHSKHVSPDFSPSMTSRAYAHSSLSPNQQCHTNILCKGRKRVAYKSDEEIKSQRQEHKLSTPVSPTSSPAPPSKRPRIRSTNTSGNKGGIRADLLKKMTKK